MTDVKIDVEQILAESRAHAREYALPCEHCQGEGEIDNPAYRAWLEEHPQPDARDEERYYAWLDQLAAWHQAHGLETLACVRCEGTGRQKLPFVTVGASDESIRKAVEKLAAQEAQDRSPDERHTRAQLYAAVVRVLNDKLDALLSDPDEIANAWGFGEHLRELDRRGLNWHERRLVDEQPQEQAA